LILTFAGECCSSEAAQWSAADCSTILWRS